MSTCRCCLTPHPSRLLERFNSSIQTIKLIRRNCSIFETILLDEYEQYERISSNLNKYLMHYGTISALIYSYLSQFTIRLNNRLENITKYLSELECLTIKCSIWLKNNSIKSIRSQLKHYGKQLNFFNNFVEQHSYLIPYKNKFSKDFSNYQTNYQQKSLQMDSIEYEHMKIFIESIQLFFSITSPENHENKISTINIHENINEWKENNKFRITWLPNEHIKSSSSDIQIKAIENYSNDNQEKCAYESNLSWSFIVAKKKEDLSIPSIEPPPKPTVNIPKTPPIINRVRLAIEAIERNNKSILRERKS